MRLTEAAEPRFARHETFHPRYGWFRKAYSFVVAEPRVFSREDAPVRVGVGKNMVRAIRFWGLAAKLIEADPRCSEQRTSDLIPTPLGHALFGQSGWDQYMEDPGTLWLLHWLLLAPPSLLPVWWLAFNEFHAVEFADHELETAMIIQLASTGKWASPHGSSVKKDVSALLRSYVPAEHSGRNGLEDVLDCPLRELNLIGRSPATNRYRFTLGGKPALPAAVLAYTILDYADRADIRGNTITLGRLAGEPGAPGKAFRLTEGELLSALEAFIGATDGLALTNVTGAAQLSWSAKPRETANEILDDYYKYPVRASQGNKGDGSRAIVSAVEQR